MRHVLVVMLVCALATPAWAKTVKISKGTINATQLHEELLARFPQWRGTPQPDGSLADPLLQLGYNKQEIILMIPDDADEAAIHAVVAAHIPKAKKAKKRANRQATMTLEERVSEIETQLGME